MLAASPAADTGRTKVEPVMSAVPDLVKKQDRRAPGDRWTTPTARPTPEHRCRDRVSYSSTPCSVPNESLPSAVSACRHKTNMPIAAPTRVARRSGSSRSRIARASRGRRAPRRRRRRQVLAATELLRRMAEERGDVSGRSQTGARHSRYTTSRCLRARRARVGRRGGEPRHRHDAS